jgi:hypothetical protein
VWTLRFTLADFCVICAIYRILCQPNTDAPTANKSAVNLYHHAVCELNVLRFATAAVSSQGMTCCRVGAVLFDTIVSTETVSTAVIRALGGEDILTASVLLCFEGHTSTLEDFVDRLRALAGGSLPSEFQVPSFAAHFEAPSTEFTSTSCTAEGRSPVSTDSVDAPGFAW